MRIDSLCNAPGFIGQVADRGWRAWWRDSGVTLAAYRAGIEASTRGSGLPISLVAHDGDTYLGSVLLIENDLDARPGLSPWIAALWVEPVARRRGIAATLIDAARAEAAAQGHATCYLCAEPQVVPYYLARGFRCLERDVEGMSVLAIHAPCPPAAPRASSDGSGQ